MRKQAVQITFEERRKYTKAGKLKKRPGPKPAERANVRHRARPVHKRWNPMHVTLRAVKGLPSFRSEVVFAAFERAVRITKRMRDDFRIGRREQYRVVPLGFDLSAFAAVDDRDRTAARATLGIDAGAEVVSTVGRLTAIKQHRLFLDAVAAAAAARPRLLALIAGDGELRGDLEAYARRLGIADPQWRRLREVSRRPRERPREARRTPG